MNLTPLQLYILLHIKRAQVEYAKMIMKMTKVDLNEIQDAIDYLMKMGFLERDSGSAIKNTRARFKRASEVHKHHTYYQLSRKGTLFLRKIDKNFLKIYFDDLLGPGGFELISILASSKDLDEACGKFGRNCEKMKAKLEEYEFVNPSGKKTRLFRKFAIFAEL